MLRVRGSLAAGAGGGAAAAPAPAPAMADSSEGEEQLPREVLLSAPRYTSGEAGGLALLDEQVLASRRQAEQSLVSSGQPAQGLPGLAGLAGLAGLGFGTSSGSVSGTSSGGTSALNVTYLSSLGAIVTIVPALRTEQPRLFCKLLRLAWRLCGDGDSGEIWKLPGADTLDLEVGRLQYWNKEEGSRGGLSSAGSASLTHSLMSRLKHLLHSRAPAHYGYNNVARTRKYYIACYLTQLITTNLCYVH